jgi:hypothetical protein
MNDFIVSNSEVPVIRAGSSNLVWPIMAIALFMLIRSSELPMAGQVTVSVFLLATMALGIRLFITTVARITFLNEAIEVLLAVTSKKIQYHEIDCVELTRLRLTPLLRIRIRLKETGRWLQFSIRGPITRWGTLAESSAAFRTKFESKGVVVRER